MSSRLLGRLISMTSAHRSSPSAPISTSLKTQATHPPSVRERTRTYPTAVAPPISRRSRGSGRDDFEHFRLCPSPQSAPTFWLSLVGQDFQRAGCFLNHPQKTVA